MLIYNILNIISADRMRSNDFHFNEDDVSNIDKVIEALHELVCRYFTVSLSVYWCTYVLCIISFIVLIKRKVNRYKTHIWLWYKQ